MSIRRYKPKAKIISDINVTPFVDVVLVLLIIFMLTAPILKTNIDIELPDSKNANYNQPKNSLTITVDAEGVIYIEDKKIDPNKFSSELTTLIKGNKDTVVYIKGDKKIPYNNIIELIDKINSAGISNVALSTNSK